MSETQLPLDPSSSLERRYALVVGVNGSPTQVHLPSLKGAEENAKAVADILQEHGDWTLLGEPLLGTDATTSAVRQALNTLAQKRTDNDLLLFYFAGHGSLHEDQTGQRPVFLVTSDFDASLIEEDEATDSISLSFLQERLYEKTKAGRVVLILDCCYAGNMGSTMHDLPLNAIDNLFQYYMGASNKAALGKYRVTLAATAHDTAAWENEGAGVMTKYLLAALRGECVDAINQNGQMTVERLYDYLRSVMPDKQKPSLSTNTQGRSIILATFSEQSVHAFQAQQRVAQLQERRERLQILSAAPEGERFLRDRLESFVGRELELRDIQQCIITVQPSGGYITITGQAGQGKSSVIAALIAQYVPTPEEREHIPFHFIPFNPGPDYQVSLLRNLMARLIVKYDLSDLYVASEQRSALRDLFPKVLSDVAAKGGQEIIFIDGLDQIESDLNGVRDLSFLPTNPPEGIVFVLGTRPDDTLKPLTLLKPTQAYLLPPLSREDFSRLLQRRHVPPLEPQLADQFYEKMQQNALYLDLLARELHNQGPITPDAIETIIRRLAENPDNIFSFALERLERRGDWQEVVKPLLGVFLVAYEPLTPWQLRIILNLDHRQVENGLQSLSGLITHIEQRYALYHLKFQDFLRQDEARPDKPYILAIDEEVGYHVRLVQWCERDQISVIWEDSADPNEQSKRLYVRHHYVSHLYASRQWERLFAVLDEQSYGKAKERYDVGARSYIQDLKKGCLAATRDGWTDEQHLKYLPHLWRYTLLSCSIRSTADQYPLELFDVMLVLGKEREVTGLIELITEPYKKVKALLLLAHYLFPLPERKQEGAAIYLRAEKIAHSIQDAKQQVGALRALIIALAQAQQWEQAEEVARSVEDFYEQVSALTSLVAVLIQAQQGERAKQLLSEVEESARSIEDVYECSRTLRVLVTTLAQAQQWKQAEEIACSIGDAFERVVALTSLAIALIQSQQREKARRIFSQAEGIAHSIGDAKQQAGALRALVTVLAQAQQWKRAEEIARSIERADERSGALIVLATSLAQNQQWKQAEEVVRSVENFYEQSVALASLAIALAQAQQGKQAEEVARSIKVAFQQARALVVLVTALAQNQQWKQAEEVARSIEVAFQQARALAIFVAALAQAQQEERAKRFLSEAEEVVRSIRDVFEQARILVVFVVALVQAQEWKQAEEIARSIQDTSEQVSALTSLAIALTQAQQGKKAKRLLSEAKEIARSTKYTARRSFALEALVTALAQAQQWKQAEEVARSIEGAYNQTKALREFVALLAQAQQWKQAEKVARSIEDVSEQVVAITLLATALAQVQQGKRAKQLLLEAEEIARSIGDVFERSSALVALVIALAQTQEWKQAEEVARSIEGAYEHTRALAELVTSLAQAQEWKQAEEVARSIEDTFRQAEALMTLAVALAQAQQEEKAKSVFSQVETVTRSIEMANGQLLALRAFAVALAQAQQEEKAKSVFSQVETVTRSIERVYERVQSLIALATALTKQEYHSSLLSFVQRSWQQVETRDEALGLFPLASGLITHTPTLGLELYQSFQWVEGFFSGS